MAETDTAAGATDNKAAAGTEGQGQTFRVLKIYLKDVSFESPLSPQVFASDQNLRPQVGLQLNTEMQQLENDQVETTLNLQVTVKSGDDVIYLVEVKQAGLFVVKGFDDRNKAGMLNVYCPNMLFPFAREEIASLVAKGGFPQLLLEPVDFQALYAQHLQKLQQNAPAPETQQ